MTLGTAAGVDSMPPEVYKLMPFIVCIFYWPCFRRRQNTLDDEEPLGWKIMEYIGIPKNDCPNSNRFDNLRWIAKLCCSQKWYQRVVRRQLRCSKLPSPVATFGFKKRHRKTNIIAIMRQSVHTAFTFQGQSVLHAWIYALHSMTYHMTCLSRP